MMKTKSKNRIISFILCLIFAFQAISLFVVSADYCGVISKDEKTLNEGKTGKSAEKALIEQKMKEQPVQQDYYYIETTKRKVLETTKARETAKSRDTNRIAESHSARDLIKAPVSNSQSSREALTSPSSDLPNRNYQEQLITPTGVANVKIKDVYTAPSRELVEEEFYVAPSSQATARDSLVAPSAKAAVRVQESKLTPTTIKVVVPEEKYEPPKAQTTNKSIFDAFSEPTAGAMEVRYVESNGFKLVDEEKNNEDAENRIRFKGKSIISAKSEQKKFIDFTNSTREETKDTTTNENAGRVIGTQLGHTQLYDNLYDKNRVIAAGGGGGMGEGGGAIRKEDHGSGGMSMTITDSFANLPTEVIISHTTNEEIGNELIKETLGKAQEEGKYNEAEKGTHAGKKIFELDRNGDFGIDNKPEGIDTGKLIMFLGILGTFIIGMLSFTLTSRNVLRKQEFF